MIAVNVVLWNNNNSPRSVSELPFVVKQWLVQQEQNIGSNQTFWLELLQMEIGYTSFGQAGRVSFNWMC